MSSLIPVMVPVTLLYGGMLVVLVVLLGSWISIRRLFIGRTARIGQPHPDELKFAIRAHGNAAEWIPLGIVALLLCELGKAPSNVLHIAGGSLVALRGFHAFYALNGGRPFPVAVVVAVLHYTLLAGLGLGAVWLHFSR
jgi:uncharacterized membrane protein YecN with MAPEG domain